MKFDKKPTLICIVGPTAIGKTALAIEVANHFSTEIISADSRQFYREMSIGTAVPSAEELAAAPHHFIQHTSIFDKYTVGDFEKEALQKLDGIFTETSVAVMAGGSGLYVDAVVKGLDYFPEVDPNIREHLNNQLNTDGISSLQDELRTADPKQYKNIDINNPRRLIRALEIYRETGKPYSSFLKNKDAERNFNTVYIGLTAERSVIYDRINQRVAIMIAQGLVEEARKLYKYRKRNALQTVGYKELFNYFDGNIPLDEAISEIKKNTRRFAKRQLTWFKKNDAIMWFDHSTPTEEILVKIKAKNAL